MRKALITMAALAFVSLAGARARADEVYVAGFTAGCLGTSCTPGATSTGSSGSLTFTNASFSGTTAGGSLAFAAAPSPGANVNNLGSLTLAATPNPFVGGSFFLRVTFTAPQGITAASGGNVRTLEALITGSVSDDGQGGVVVDFGPPGSPNNPFILDFNDPDCEPDPTGGVPGQQTTCGKGLLFFTVEDVRISPGQSVALTGRVSFAQQQPVPEPATLLLFGFGMTGVAAAARRRRKAAGE